MTKCTWGLISMSVATLLAGILMRAIIYPLLAVCMALMLMGLLNGFFSIAEMQVGATNPLGDVWWLNAHRAIAGDAVPADTPIFAFDFGVALVGAIFAAIIARISRAIPAV